MVVAIAVPFLTSRGQNVPTTNGPRRKPSAQRIRLTVAVRLPIAQIAFVQGAGARGVEEHSGKSAPLRLDADVSPAHRHTPASDDRQQRRPAARWLLLRRRCERAAPPATSSGRCEVANFGVRRFAAVVSSAAAAKQVHDPRPDRTCKSPKAGPPARASPARAVDGVIADVAAGPDCDEGGPPRWDARRVTEKRVQGGPSSCCTLDWI